MDLLLQKYMMVINDPELALGSALLAVGTIVFLLLLKKFVEARKEIPLDPVTGLPMAPPLPPRVGAMASAGGDVGFSAQESTVKIDAPKTADMTKTLVLPPSDVAGRPTVDLAVYESLVRRVAALEAELKKDPLFLDPLMKRMATAEKRIDEIPPLIQRVEAVTQAVRNLPTAPAAVPGAPIGGVSVDEFNTIRDRVNGMHKILEHLAESPMNPPS